MKDEEGTECVEGLGEEMDREGKKKRKREDTRKKTRMQDEE